MKTRRIHLLSVLITVSLAVVGCLPAAQPEAPPPDTAAQQPVQVEESVIEPAAPEVEVEVVDVESAAEDPTPTPETEAGDPVLDAFTAPITAQGDILIVYGRVLDVNGDPVEGAAVEFWQTDSEGVYDHPGDPGTGSRDMGFQFYGTSISDADGTYIFRTILPGRYEPRPRHIHVKVKLNGAELLTTQFYFAEDGTSGGVGGSIENLLLSLEQAATSDGLSVNVATFDVVVDTGIGAGALRLTDSQGEGPYYPVVKVADYDNDLSNVGE